MSSQPLSLHRVPPTALVGYGAREFAEQHGMATWDNKHLVSKMARDRFLRWSEDLRRAEGISKEAKPSPSTTPLDSYSMDPQYDTASPGSRFSRDHAAAIVSGTWNEGQTDSPNLGTPTSEASSTNDNSLTPGYFRNIGSSLATVGRSSVRATAERINSRATGSPTKRSPQQHSGRSNNLSRWAEEIRESHRDGTASPSLVGQEKLRQDREPSSDSGLVDPRHHLKRRQSASDDRELADVFKWRKHPRPSLEQDSITDTIGAIAIDDQGHIAAGSSSGGIGLKHQGRLGPAALVGVGTAVVPRAEDDVNAISVAAVTSGTGEHMATTMASQRCAERIYQGTRRGPGNIDIRDDDEDAIMCSFVTNDFMGHPGVKHCNSTGAVGVMVVKTSRTGYYFYFAHNTDSFALASMAGNEKEPRCTMSRLSNGAKVAQGGRKIRYD